MKSLHFHLLTLCITLATGTLVSNPNDLKLVCFNEPEHGAQARAIYRQAFKTGYDLAFLNKVPSPESPFKVEVLLAKDTVAGFVVFSDLGKRHRTIDWLAIDEPYRKSDLHCGTYVMQQKETQARDLGIRAMILSPRTDDVIPFYEKLGYKLENKRASIMSKILNPSPEDAAGERPTKVFRYINDSFDA